MKKKRWYEKKTDFAALAVVAFACLSLGMIAGSNVQNWYDTRTVQPTAVDYHRVIDPTNVTLISNVVWFADEPTTNWQFDKYRKAIEKYKAQYEYAQEFNKTNKILNEIPIVEPIMFDWRPQKGDLELGYRSDGVVVWRELPEGK